MEDKEKILRWNLKDALEKSKSDVGEVPFVHMAFAIEEERLKEVKKCKKELDDYLKSK